MKMDDGVLTIFPTELARRRAERNAVIKSGVIDSSRLFTQKKLMDLCERAARRQGLLTGRVLGPAELQLLLEQTADSVPFAAKQPLASLSAAACGSLLLQLIEQLAFLAEDSAAVTEWPLVSAPMAEALTSSSRAAIQRNLSWMEAQGLVRELTGQGRYRMWRTTN